MDKDIPCRDCLCFSICLSRVSSHYKKEKEREETKITNKEHMTWCILSLSPDCTILKKIVYHKSKKLINFYLSYMKEGENNE